MNTECHYSITRRTKERESHPPALRNDGAEVTGHSSRKQMFHQSWRGGRIMNSGT